MPLQTYELSAGAGPNPVYNAAMAYLDAAEVVYEKESAKSGFLAFPNWHVVHHLSFIASELFLKSFRVTIRHPPSRTSQARILKMWRMHTMAITRNWISF